MTSRRRRAVAMVASLAAASLALGATSASAVIVHLRNGKTLSYQPLRGAPKPLAAIRPFDAFFTNLDYNGGPVMASNTNYAIYWRPTGAPAYPAGYQAGINQYFTDLAHDSGGHQNVDSVAAQYNDTLGAFAAYNSHFGGALIDTDPYPKTGNCTHATICITDEQIQAELVKFVKAQSLPTDLAHEYFMLTPEGVEDCFGASSAECSAGSTSPAYCAYHGNIPVGQSQLIYANDPYVSGNPSCDDPKNHPNGISDGALMGGLSHEHNESITDPLPNSGWANMAEGGSENGDKCRNFEFSEFGEPMGKAPDGANYNQVINGHLYWYQQEWSNEAHECLQQLPLIGEEPRATFTSTPETGTKMAFDAEGSTTASGPVAQYNWQFNDGPGLSTPVETTTPTVNHEFPLVGKYLVALTVFAKDGTSIGTARTIVTGDEGPTAAFFVPTATPTAGQSVSFNGLASSDSDGSIKAYEWNFGDGSPPATGALQSHTYAAAGAYDVTLTVTDSTKQTASTTVFVAVVQTATAASVSPASSPPAPVAAPAPIPPPDSAFGALGALVNPSTGAITFTESVGNPGTFSWLIVFQNGRFGVFAASRSNCRRGFVRLKRRCRPSSIVFARGSKLVAGAGAVTFRITPTASGMKALRTALRQKRGMRVSVRLTFQSSRGGSPVSQTSAMTVRLRRRR